VLKVRLSLPETAGLLKCYYWCTKYTFSCLCLEPSTLCRVSRASLWAIWFDIYLTLEWLNFFLLHLQGDGAEEKYELPPKEKADICTIMYTSGTTGDPKGVLISNKSIIAIVTAVDQFLSNSNEQVQLFMFHCSFLYHWDIFSFL
jgi:non-ribosomal peptide synthetase component F